MRARAIRTQACALTAAARAAGAVAITVAVAFTFTFTFAVKFTFAVAGTVTVAGLLPGQAFAREPVPAFTNGRLWRISRRGVSDSFVLGTIHVPDPRVAVITGPMNRALARSRTMAMELSTAVVDAQLFELEEFNNGQRLEPMIGAESYARLRAELAAQGLADPTIERLKPWAAMIRIARAPSGSAAISLDQQLLLAARARNMRVTTLELVEEQIASFDSIPIESQVALLKHALAHREALAATIEPTIEAWMRGDLAALARIPDSIDRQFPGMGHHYAQLAKHIIGNRTVLLHHRLFMPLRAGRVFVAVGAMHLPGKDGLLAMLERDGFRVSRVW